MNNEASRLTMEISRLGINAYVPVIQFSPPAEHWYSSDIPLRSLPQQRVWPLAGAFGDNVGLLLAAERHRDVDALLRTRRLRLALCRNLQSTAASSTSLQMLSRLFTFVRTPLVGRYPLPVYC